MDKACQLTFIGRRDGNHTLTVTHRKLRIGLHDAGSLGGLQHLLQPFGRLPLAFTNRAANRIQLLGGRITHRGIGIDHAVDLCQQMREALHTPRQGEQRLVLGLAVADKTHHLTHRTQGRTEHHHLLHIEERTLHLQFADHLHQIGILPTREVVLHHQELAHLVGQRQTALNLLRHGRKGLLLDASACRGHRGERGHLLTQTVETDLLFEGRGIDHRYSAFLAALAAFLVSFLTRFSARFSAFSFAFSASLPKTERCT